MPEPNPIEQQLDEDLIEKLAGYAHDAWSGWMRYMFGRGYRHVDSSFLIQADAVQRWTRQMNTPYADLPESERASDRDEARKILAIVRGE